MAERPRRRRSARVEALLVQMPFAPVTVPSIGLSLLKAVLAREGISSEILYFNLSFAARSGMEVYLDLSEEYPYGIYNQVGEWIFSGALFGQSEADQAKYVENVLRAPPDLSILLMPPASESFIEQVIRVRGLVKPFLDTCLERVLELRPRVVGFSSMYQQHVASLALARHIKEQLPDACTVFGGANCEHPKGLETVRQFPFVDVAVSGEGELVFPEIVQRALRGMPVGGTDGVHVNTESVPMEPALGSSIAPCVHDLDELPLFDYDDYLQQLQASCLTLPRKPRLLFETSRGCSWGMKNHCTFCSLNGATMRFRKKSGVRALRELTELARRHPGNNVSITDNMLSMDYFESFVPALARRELPITITCETLRPNLTKQQVQALADARMRRIQPGIESLSDPVLKIMRKGVSALHNIQLLKWCEEFGIEVLWNLLWGFPSEPPEAYTRMARLLPLLTHLQPPQAFGAILVGRFSPLFERAEAMGLIGISPSPAYSHIYPFEEAALARLAQYFVYDYRVPQNVSEYTAPVIDQIRSWQEVHCDSGLWALDGAGKLHIWDERPVAMGKLITLRGRERIAYLACDRVRSLEGLRKTLGDVYGVDLSRVEVETLLQPLLERFLMLQEGDRVLSLAVQATNPTARRKLRERIRRQIADMEESISREFRGNRVRILEMAQDVQVSVEEIRSAYRAKRREDYVGCPALIRCRRTPGHRVAPDD